MPGFYGLRSDEKSDEMAEWLRALADKVAAERDKEFKAKIEEILSGVLLPDRDAEAEAKAEKIAAELEEKR